jgi:hypothetical protein
MAAKRRRRRSTSTKRRRKSNPRRRSNPFSPAAKGITEFVGGGILGAAIVAGIAYFRGKSAISTAPAATASTTGSASTPATQAAALQTSLEGSGLYGLGVAIVGGGMAYMLDKTAGIGFALGAVGAAGASALIGANAQALAQDAQGWLNTTPGGTTTPTSTTAALMVPRTARAPWNRFGGVPFGAVTSGGYFP